VALKQSTAIGWAAPNGDYQAFSFQQQSSWINSNFQFNFGMNLLFYNPKSGIIRISADKVLVLAKSSNWWLKRLAT